MGARNDRAASLYSVDRVDPDHDAVLRIGGEAPRRRVHSEKRHSRPCMRADHRLLGSSLAHPSHQRRTQAEVSRALLVTMPA